MSARERGMQLSGRAGYGESVCARAYVSESAIASASGERKKSRASKTTKEKVERKYRGDATIRMKNELSAATNPFSPRLPLRQGEHAANGALLEPDAKGAPCSALKLILVFSGTPDLALASSMAPVQKGRDGAQTCRANARASTNARVRENAVCECCAGPYPSVRTSCFKKVTARPRGLSSSKAVLNENHKIFGPNGQAAA
eukprot:5560951-Pleurochrysis_carterae.AAC.1